MDAISFEEAREIIEYYPDSGQFRWKVDRTAGVKKGDLAGCLGSRGYWRLRLKGRDYTGHRVAWLLSHGRWPDLEIDHINGKPHDNRLVNLRLASREQNRANSRGFGASGLKGVTFHKKTGKWQAIFGFDGKHIYLGLYANKLDAKRVYDAAAKAQNGEFARSA